MSKDQRFDDLKYEDAKETIEAILSRKTLPVVVRVVDDGVKNKNMHICAGKIPLDKEILLQCKLKVKYAHIQVLNYHDNEVREREMGPEFVLEHDSYVGEDFLIPAKYGGEMKLIRRPRCRGRYVTVSEIIERLPRYVIVQEDFEANLVDEKVLKTNIRKQTILEILDVTQSPITNKKLLIFFDGKRKYSLEETKHVNVTEVDDDKPYHLHDFVRYKMLPKVIKFAAEAEHDVISHSSQNRTIDMAIFDGPLDLIGFVDLEVIVGWIRDKSLKTYTTILIPRDMWKSATVQERALQTVNDEIQYIRRKYGHTKSIEFVEKGLYTRILDDYNVVYLSSPELFLRTNSADVTMIQFEDSSDEDKGKEDEERCDNSDDEAPIYEEILEEPPPIPERIPLMSIVKKKKSVFAKVHEELLSLKTKLKSTNHHEASDGTSIPSRPPKSKKVQRAASSLPTTTKVASIQRPLSHTDDHTPPEQPCAPIGLKSKSLDIVALTKRPFPAILSETPRYESVSSIREEDHNTMYSELKTEDPTTMFSDQQTADDFYKYSVINCFHCFRYCGLDEFADKCLENKIDGAFFKNTDFDFLKETPFCLQSFHVVKVKKIINGWRPLTKTSNINSSKF
ncbi:hypothetical protein ACF0H5_004899 [Mactra antiquata]